MTIANLETITDTQSWCRTWPLNGSRRIRAQTKTSQETQRSLQKFLEPDRKPKVVYTENSLEFGKACEDLSWNHCTSTPHRSETNGIAEKSSAQSKKKAPLLYCCNRGLDEKLAGKKQNLDPMWKLLNKEVDLGEPTSFLDHVYLGCTQRQCQISKDIVDNYRTMFESRISAGGTEKLPFPQNLSISSWSYDMAGHAKKCVERYCE